MNKSLYADWEYQDVGPYLQSVFGKKKPERHELDAWRLEEIRALHASPMFFRRNYLIIPDKDSNLIRYEPFIGQVILDICFRSQEKRGYAQRIVEIKPRQVGWTTDNIGRAIAKTLRPNVRAMILVDDEDVAGEKATLAGTMINNLPTWLQPMRRIDNLKRIVFDQPNAKLRGKDPGLNSQLIITVPSSMRGVTPQFVVVSEFAFMDSVSQVEVMEGLIGAMPLRENSAVVVDTTPNGYDETYYPLVKEAVENNPKWAKQWERRVIPTRAEVIAGLLGEPDHPRKGWVPAFCPWFWHEEYTTADENPRGELSAMSAAEKRELAATLGKIEKYGGAEETDLRERFGVTPGRMFWRRTKIDSYKQPNDRLRLLSFRQEYASTWDGCFIDYGHAPFDVECLDIVMRQGREPAARGALREDNRGVYLDPSFRSDWWGWRIYGAPESGERYVIGVDCGVAYENRASDATVAQVLRVRDDKVMATFTARAPDYVLIEQLYLGYRWYNNAYLGIETKQSGYNLCRRLFDRGATNQYYWRRNDKALPETTEYLGWETSDKSRPEMESYLVELIDWRSDGRPDPRITIPDKETLRELMSVKRESSGKIKAPGNNHDDHVDALMIALALARDPYGGQYRVPVAVQRQELNALAKRLGMTETTQRNRPDLANL
jgi:hypothetical protein